MKQLQLLIILLILTTKANAQVKYGPEPKDSIQEPFLYMVEGDSIARESIALNEIVILDKLQFDTALERRKYLILTRKTIKVYPYAKMAADTLTKLRADLQDIRKKRHRKRYIKQMQEFMEERFTKELKKFSRTEGQILVKLIHRQTGHTMFDLIKDYRSGWKAFWYQRTASLFNISLKREFKPNEVYEDYLIEDILERCFQNDVLERQKPAIKFNILNLIDKWKSYKPTPVN